ncbi:CPBP family intramembrane glutamic endopeptidase [Microbacterium sp. MYb62]|uniref:CPBP family intramembrane glutamic endopeptidase n=1 Tax=Microbacterium sp. MYb62 TaxID=1848690 RepID=UPI0015E3506A|nr:CPBP family intramembrane glutamic endopeptidase [Microbacterium sp. MYb62]
MAEAMPRMQSFRRAWVLLAVRLGSVVVVTLGMWLVVRAATGVDAFPPNTMWATLGLVPVNVLCLVLVRRFLREQGVSLGAALGVRRGRVGRDVLWGLLWLFVLNVPFMAVVTGTVFLLYGREAPSAFATIFFDPASSVRMDPVVLLVISLVAVVPFMLINAPTEELVFRGYGLDGIASRWSVAAAIVTTSLLFGAQHILFAATVPGMLIYFLAFTVWGLCAAIIVRRQGRLLPVVIAHWIVNITMSSPAIILPILQISGAIPAL